MSTGTPDAEIQPDAELVRMLLQGQHPELAERPITLVAAGWDNSMFRLGDDLAVRLPRRELAACLMEREQRWLPEVAAGLPLPAPIPVRVGRPGAGYPWPWSVVPWLPGQPADVAVPAPETARVLGRFLRALHRPAPAQAPRSPHRGVPLAARDDTLMERLGRLAGQVDTVALREIWRRAARLPATSARGWIHGDLHPRNLLVAGGRVTGVIDWGDLAAGDPATDLMAAWALYDAGARAALMDEYGDDGPALWGRARGWALFFGVILLDVGLVDDPRLAEVGRRMLGRVVAEG